MNKSVQIIEFLLEFNFKLTTDDIKNLKVVKDVMDTKKKREIFNFLYLNDSVHNEHINDINKGISEVNLMIDNCLETDVERLTILRMYVESLSELKEEFVDEFNKIYLSLDKSKFEKKLIDDCIVSIFNGKSDLYKIKDNGNSFKMMGNKYSIDISLLDTIFEILENKELVDEIKINLSYKKEKDQIKDKLLLYKLISDNRDIIELYIEKKFILSNLKNSIKDIRRKLELVRERESRLSGRIINYFSNDDCKLKGLELSLKEAVSTCCKLEDEIKDMINNISNEKLKEIISNISFYSNDLELDENDILELEERLDEISEIECSERVRKLIDGDSDICEIVVNLSNKKQRNNKTPIISFYILKSLSDFYKNNIFTCDDKKMEDSYKDLINEINVRNEEKLKSISNIDVSINVGKYVKTKHST